MDTTFSFCVPSNDSFKLLSEEVVLVEWHRARYWVLVVANKEYLRSSIPYVRSFEGLVKLAIIGQIGFILSIVITIIRKNRTVNGERLCNVSLKESRYMATYIQAFYAQDVEKLWNHFKVFFGLL